MAHLNDLTPEEFVRLIGPVFENSPWIAEAAAARRPFAAAEQLLAALREIVLAAPEEKKLALIRGHPDLAGRAALANALTVESSREQSDAGLGRLSPEEMALFRCQNAAYRAKFDFPFIICARLNKKDAILAGFDRRLPNSRETEVKTALEEIFKIAELRLGDIVEN